MMGNSRHGGRKFRSIAEAANRRTTAGILNARRESEADIRQALYVGPDGRGYDLIQDQDTGEQSSVRDLAGGLTVKPGSQVPIASFSGSHAEFRIGAPPGGGAKFGSPPRGYRPYGTITPVVEIEANQYAFGDGGDGTIRAWLYSDESWISDRGSTAVAFDLAKAGVILTDSGGFVGDGSLIARDGSGSFRVWDVEGEATYDVPLTSGYVGGFPVYMGGYLYWPEVEDVVGTPTAIAVVVRRARCDFSSPETLETHSLDISADTFISATYWQWALTPLAGIVWISYLSSGGSAVARIRLTLSGTGTTEDSANSNELGAAASEDYGVPVGSAALIAISNGQDGSYVHSQADDGGDAPYLFWPDTFGQGDADCGNGSNLSPGGGLFQVFGASINGTDGYTIRDSATVAPIGASPAVAFVPENHPVVGSAPEAMFYFGEE